MDIAQLLMNRSMPEQSHATALMGLSELQKRPDNLLEKHRQLEATAKNFEGIFVRQILKQMQETIENASFDPDDNAGKQVHSMYSSFLGDAITEQGGLGLWQEIYDQMARMEGLEPKMTETQLNETA